MKYLGVISFIILTAWTWNVVHSEADIGFETHSGIQEKLSALIQETIKAKKPSVTEVKIEKIWTEPLPDNKVKAYFIYSFSDENTRTTIQGEGLLERQPDDGSGLDRWSLTKVKTTNDAIIFEDGLVVTPHESDNTSQ